MTALLGDMITAQAHRTPHAVAVRQWDERLTYRELVDVAAMLASELRDLGVGPEVRVGICARRTVQLPVAAVGVILAGGAYVPLDPAHPRRRLDAVLDDADISVVVADDVGRTVLEGCGRQIVSVPKGFRAEAAANPSKTWATRADNAAYVLYTSGSTGEPKGVVISHRSVASFIAAIADYYALDDSCRAIAFASFGFDVSVLDLFAPLTRGGSVQLVGDDDRVDPARLQRFLEAHEVTWGSLPPAVLPLLDPSRLVHLRDLLAGGEPPGPEQVERWSAPPRRRFYNWYGPTETTVQVIGNELRGSWDRPLPIGHPFADCEIHILDEALQPCPPGARGELYVGGPQVARGYLGRPGLTAECFVPDPIGSKPGARLYKTGDLAQADADGRIHFLGRLDHQVKIQGQRVEIGEVEAVARSHPRVAHAVVDITNASDVVAYLAPRTAPDLAELREYCADRLPAYMLPTRAVRLDALPMNAAAGKVDLAALRSGPGYGHVGAHNQGQNEGDGVTGRVGEIWGRVLESGPPSADDDFFACGGHSLRAMRLVSALRVELGCDVSVEDIFSARTLAGLVERVRVAGHADDSIPTNSSPSLSPAQHRLWFMEQLSPGTTAHNIAFAERLNGPLDADALRAALTAVVARHEVLRWRVRATAGVPSVAVDPEGEVPLPVDDLVGLNPTARDRTVREILDCEARTPFDLASGPLIRTRLVRFDDTIHVLVLTVHHLVFDGWSQEVLYRDLAQAYRGERLDPRPVGFGDYVGWLRQRAAAHGTDDLTWWKAHLDGAPTILDLPRDGARPALQTFNGTSCQIEAAPELAAAVQDLASRVRTTRYAVLLAAFGQLLRRLTGQSDMVVGTPYSDRRRQAFEPLVGFCLQILPLRLRTDDDSSFAEHVSLVQREVADAIEHCDAPLERIVDSLGLPRDLSRSPLTQVLFNMYNFEQPHLHIEGCSAEPLEAGLPGSLFDLTMYVSEAEDRLTFKVVYNPDLYSAERMDEFLRGYLALLESLVRGSEDPVQLATMRSPESRLPDPTVSLPAWDGPGVVELIERASSASPDEVAVTGEGGTMTYAELDDLRVRTASTVREAGIHPGQTVAVLAQRHVALPALLLGVLTSGARWTVLDPSHPPALRARQAAAAGACALLCCPGAVPFVEKKDAVPAPLISKNQREYVVFTSGSTGEPKPVVTPERPLAHFIDRYVAAFGLGPDDRFALLSGLAHDPVLRDMFTPLAVGGRLCVPSEDWLRDPQRLTAWLADEQVTIAHVTPQLARLIYRGAKGRTLPSMRLILIGGDHTVEGDAMGLRRVAPLARLFNVYGTTETPQVHAWHEIGACQDESLPVPVGHGFDGSQLLIVDPSDRLAGVGELGEVVVRSRHLADGYLDPDLTAERFAHTPGIAASDDRMYRTGDLGRYRPGGVVQLAGRIDDQVKIRGYRVELGEIEAALLSHPDVVAACAAVTRGPHNSDSDCTVRAYVVSAHASSVHPHELLDHLRTRLPDHAVPAGIQLVPHLPTTPSGKVDRAALPGPARSESNDPSADELHTDTEQAVAEVWRSVLGRGRVGRSSNFFELGGDSLAIISVQARLAGRIGREIPVVDLFRYPTVRALAAHLDGNEAGPGLDRAARRAAMRRERLRRRRHTLETSREHT